MKQSQIFIIQSSSQWPSFGSVLYKTSFPYIFFLHHDNQFRVLFKVWSHFWRPTRDKEMSCMIVRTDDSTDLELLAHFWGILEEFLKGIVVRIKRKLLIKRSKAHEWWCGLDGKFGRYWSPRSHNWKTSTSHTYNDFIKEELFIDPTSTDPLIKVDMIDFIGVGDFLCVFNLCLWAWSTT